MHCGSLTLAKLFLNQAQHIQQYHVRPVLTSANPLHAVIWQNLLLSAKRPLYLILLQWLPLACSNIIIIFKQRNAGIFLRWLLHTWVGLCGQWINATLFSFGLMAWNELRWKHLCLLYIINIFIVYSFQKILMSEQINKSDKIYFQLMSCCDSGK